MGFPLGSSAPGRPTAMPSPSGTAAAQSPAPGDLLPVVAAVAVGGAAGAVAAVPLPGSHQGDQPAEVCAPCPGMGGRLVLVVSRNPEFTQCSACLWAQTICRRGSSLLGILRKAICLRAAPTSDTSSGLPWSGSKSSSKSLMQTPGITFKGRNFFGLFQRSGSVPITF